MPHHRMHHATILAGLVAAAIVSSAARAQEQVSPPSGAHESAAAVPLPPTRPFSFDTPSVARVPALAAAGAARITQARIAGAVAEPAALKVAAFAPWTPPAGPQEGAAPTIDALVARHATEIGIPVQLAKAVVRIESRGNPRATNHGAMGLMQIKTDTARRLGFRGTPAALLVADTNLVYGMKVLAEAYRTESGDICRTLAYYQSGHRVRSFSAANRAYCSKARVFMARS